MKASFEGYDAYKDSGVEWLGEVPEHWTVLPLKELASKSNSSFVDGPFGSDLKSNEYTDTGVPLIQLNNIGIGFHSTKNLKFISEEKALSLSKHRAFSGEIAIAKMAEPVAWATVISNVFAMYVIVADCIKFKPNSRIADNHFVAYALNTTFVKSQAEVLSKGTTRIRINLGTTKILKVVTPPLPEQKAIVDYLDTKTTQIDCKIDLLTHKATQYGKLKQSLINETVTRGLDKTVAMKDSGVEWIGEVPEHWQVRRVKELGNLVLGKMLDNNYGDGKLFKRYLKSKNIGWLVPNVTSVEEMYFSPYEIRLYRIKQGDLLFSEGGEVGKTSFWNNDVEECYIQNSVHKLTINRFNYSRYFMYLSYTAGHSGYYDSIVNFVSIKHLTKEKLSRVIWPVPSIQEQKAIADYLDTKTAHVDRIIETINTQIEKLKELRKTLISDVVTGKIKVA